MQTAVEFHHDKSTELIHQFLDKKITERELLTMHHNLFYPSQEMEKDQIISAYKNGQKIVEQYYKETYEIKTDNIWDDIYDEYSKEQYPPFGGPFTNSISFIDWLKQYYKTPEKINNER